MAVGFDPAASTMIDVQSYKTVCPKSANIAFLTKIKGRVNYRSLLAAIVEAVDSGVLMPGDRMPSSRDLAAYTGTSRTTVARAFDCLIARGYLCGIKGSGTMVAHRHQPQVSEPVIIQPDFGWNEHLTDLAQQLMAPESQSVVASGDCPELNWGTLPLELLPVQEWRRLIHQHCQKRYGGDALVQGALAEPVEPAKQDSAGQQKLVGEVFGYLPLRQAIAAFLRRTKGIRCSAEQIVLYSGTQNPLAHIGELLFKPGQLAICEEPGYPGAREQFRVHGIDVATVPVDQGGIVVDSLSKIAGGVQWLYVSPACQDPTGAVLSRPRAQQLLEWCTRNRTAIIEDAWESEFHYGTAPAPPLQSLDERGAVIYIYTFWRLLFPLTATSVLVLPQKLVPLFEKSKHLCDRQYPLIEHLALTELLASGYLEEHIRTLWKQLRKRRQALIFAITKAFGEQVQVSSSSAGMHVLANFSERFDHAQIIRSAAVARLPAVPTSFYYAGKAPNNQFMINFSCVPEETAAEIVGRFAAEINRDGEPVYE